MSLRRLLLLLLTTALVLASAPARASSSASSASDEVPVDVWVAIPVGSPGEQVTAVAGVSREGEPAPGLTVVFTRIDDGTGPEGVTDTATTDETGTARLDLVLTMQTIVRATVTDAAGQELGSATAVYSAPVCRCSPPPLRLVVRGVRAPNGDDRLALRTSEHAAGATAGLYRVGSDGRATRIRRSTLEERGHRDWRVTDHNGRRWTRYFVVVGPTETSARDRSPVVRVR